jgi:hypothetical protein
MNDPAVFGTNEERYFRFGFFESFEIKKFNYGIMLKAIQLAHW